MRAVLFFSTVCVTALAATAAAQRPAAKPAAQAPAAAAGLKASDVAGTWAFENSVKTTAGQDTVVTSEVTISADGKTWVTHLAGRDPIPARIVAMAGDSVVTESGPFQSVARPGQKVRTVEVFHFKGNDAWGTIEAHYSNREVVKGTIKGKRKK